MTDLYIDTAEALTGLCHQLRDSPWIALDTEFIREKTYYPRLCLLQVANEELVACVDPLALDNLDPLLAILYDPALTKVLHSAHQDLEIFFNLRGAVPCPVFDTQIAATVLGQAEQVGYARLVKALLGVDLDKSQTRTNWCHRPLKPAQIAYAADDVRYLCDVYRLQRSRLEAGNRLAWLADDFAGLCEPDKYQVQPGQAWRRIKGSRNLRGVQLAVLRALAAWREQRASASNRPRKWIVSDDVLLDLARSMPGDKERFQLIRGLEPGLIKRHGDTLLELIATARTEPPEQWPSPPSRLQLNPEQEALVEAMLAVVRLRGSQKGVSPQTLASRKDLERLVAGDPDIPLLQGWRAALAGHEVQALLQGRLQNPYLPGDFLYRM